MVQDQILVAADIFRENPDSYLDAGEVYRTLGSIELWVPRRVEVGIKYHQIFPTTVSQQAGNVLMEATSPDNHRPKLARQLSRKAEELHFIDYGITSTT